MHFIHVKQRHKTPWGKPPQEFIEAVVASQFNVVSAIRRHPDCPVLVEGYHDDAKDVSSLQISGAAKRIFPAGFPKELGQLNSLQKEFLYEFGGARTLLYLGEISAIYKSIHKEVSDAINKEVESRDYKSVFQPREEEAMKCAREAALKHFGKLENATVLVVFGGDHNFKPYCDRERFTHESIETYVKKEARLGSPAPIFSTSKSSGISTQRVATQTSSAFFPVEEKSKPFEKRKDDFNLGDFKFSIEKNNSGFISIDISKVKNVTHGERRMWCLVCHDKNDDKYNFDAPQDSKLRDIKKLIEEQGPKVADLIKQITSLLEPSKRFDQ